MHTYIRTHVYTYVIHTHTNTGSQRPRAGMSTPVPPHTNSGKSGIDYINSYTEDFFLNSGKSVPWYIDYINSLYRGQDFSDASHHKRHGKPELHGARRQKWAVNTAQAAGRGAEAMTRCVCVCVCGCVCVCVCVCACLCVFNISLGARPGLDAGVDRGTEGPFRLILRRLLSYSNRHCMRRINRTPGDNASLRCLCEV